jgi:hypothetical protein
MTKFMFKVAANSTARVGFDFPFNGLQHFLSLASDKIAEPYEDSEVTSAFFAVLR